MLLKITSLLKQEEASELSVSRRNLLEKSVQRSFGSLSQPLGSTRQRVFPGGHHS